MSLVTVIVDSREPEWIRKLSFGGVSVESTYLDDADLLVVCTDGETLAIERKTASDLLGSLVSDRLFPQLLSLRELSRWSYLVITGSLAPGPKGSVYADARQTAWQWSALQGALLSVQEMGVFVIFTNGDQDYEACVLRIAQRSRALTLIPPPRDFDLMTVSESVLASLPSIGPERVTSLLKHCGSPAWALHWLTDLDRNALAIPGIGPGTKTAVRKALGLADTNVLVVAGKDEIGVVVPADEGPE